MHHPLSPITNSESVAFVKNISTRLITEVYKQYPGIDVQYYLNDYTDIGLYKCLSTGYKFYYPFLVGDVNFYQQLQQLGWYYQKDRWEYAQALNFIACNETVLEVGCGQGHFLKMLQSQHLEQAVGIELNSQGVQSAKKEGLLVYEETLDQHYQRTHKQYDVVCAFQVLEHIPEVKQFLDEMLNLLKPGGKLILAVPNNDSFIKHIDLWANFPPHHVGLWNKRSVESLQNYFPLKLKSLTFEPLQCQWFYRTHLKRFLNVLDKHTESRLKVKLKALLHSPFLENISLIILKAFQEYIPGHTLLVVFTKATEK